MTAIKSTTMRVRMVANLLAAVMGCAVVISSLASQAMKHATMGTKKVVRHCPTVVYQSFPKCQSVVSD